MTHNERDALWKAYCHQAPRILAWMESMALPYFEVVIEDYLVGKLRPKRRRVDIEIAQKRLIEMRMLLQAKE